MTGRLTRNRVLAVHAVTWGLLLGGCSRSQSTQSTKTASVEAPRSVDKAVAATARAAGPGVQQTLTYWDGSNIHSINIDGTANKLLTTDGHSGGSGSWSLDGKQIAYVRTSQGHPAELYVMNRDGSNQHRILHLARC